MILYHGTSSLLLTSIEQNGILPANSTNIRMEKRKDNLDKVFLVKEKLFAEAYAIRAANKIGGEPIVLKVEADANIERTGRITQWITTVVKPKEIQEIKQYPFDLDRMISIFSGEE